MGHNLSDIPLASPSRPLRPVALGVGSYGTPLHPGVSHVPAQEAAQGSRLLAMAKAPRQKVSKAEAAYGEGMPGSKCSLCAHFQAPDACEIVEGRIGPGMWCTYFRKAQSAA